MGAGARVILADRRESTAVQALRRVAKLKLNQQDYFVAEYNPPTPVKSLDKADAGPTDVWLVFQVPQNTALACAEFPKTSKSRSSIRPFSNQIVFLNSMRRILLN